MGLPVSLMDLLWVIPFEVEEELFSLLAFSHSQG